MKHLTCVMLLGLGALTSPAFADEELLAFGSKTYKQFCSHCHGINMVSGGNSSYDLRKFPLDQKDRFYGSVLNGKGDMPAWGDILLETEMDALWHYVATRGGKQPLPEEEAAALNTPAPSTATASLVHDDALTACLARNGGAMSAMRHKGGEGMDYLMAQQIATAMDLPLKVTWFESESEEDTTPARDTIALLSAGLCDIAPGFALYEPILTQYAGTRAAIPYWLDRPDTHRRGAQVDLDEITVSVPYMRMEIGLVHREGVDVGAVGKISDLDGLKLGLEQGTLPGVLLLRQGTDDMNRTARTFNPGPEFLWHMENGVFDAALVTIGAYDFHRKQNSITTLQLHEYRHPLGFNLGVAMLAENDILVSAVNATITALNAQGKTAKFAQTAGVHYAAPRSPFVQARLSLRDLIATE
ncbi:MAG: c-type cytochrome [Roseobacter sp.]